MQCLSTSISIPVHANSMAPIIPHVKTQILKQYYFKYLLGNLHIKLYQFFYENRF